MQIVSIPPPVSAMPVTFDNAATAGGTFNSTSGSIVVGGNDAVVIMTVVAGGAITAATLGGVAGTLIGTYATNRRLYAWTGVSAGSRAFTATHSQSAVVAVASYLNVKSIEAYAATATNIAATIAGNSANDRVVSVFSRNSSLTLTATSGTLRALLSNGGSILQTAIVDDVGASVTNSINSASYATASASVRLAA